MTTDPSWMAVIVSIVGLALSQIFLVFKGVWWSSRMTTILEIMRGDMIRFQTDLKIYVENCFTKADASRELAISEKEHRAIWKRVDELRESKL